MPPRKKAPASDGTVPAPTRSSARNKTAAAATASSKPDSKRGRADDSSDDDAADSKKPLSKKAKKAPASKKAAAADDDDDKDDGPPAKMVTVLKRGRAPVDAGSNKVNTHQVYANDEGVWDAMLNQTNIGDNNNKFYVLQLLHPIGNESQCILFTRWGRVGADGQTQVKGPWAASTAINEFKKQFKSKASVPWENRVGMVPKAGKYTWIERDYGDDDEDDDQAPGGSDSKGKGKKSENSPVPTSKLEPEIQAMTPKYIILTLTSYTSIIDATLSSMNYDANKLPLGKLAKSTILNGFAALKTLSDVINEPQGDTARENGGFVKACETLSSRYYSIIPHDFGRNRPVSISSKAMLEKELELVDALGDMEIASKLIAANKKVDEDAEGNPINPMDKNFHSLNLTSMAPVKRTSAEFDVLDAYVRDTHGHTHGHIRAKITSAFRVERAAETAAWNEAGHDKLGDGERLLLWHGSRCTNFTGILSQGLRIAPPEGRYMFGKGVYFADVCVSFTRNCSALTDLSHGTGILLLCEVAAKPFYERVQAEYDADKGCKKNKAKCTLGLGKSQPKNWKDAGKALGHDELVGCHMPDGPAHDVVVPGLNGGWGLQYNEYIVYSTAQIRVRYLLMVKMN
ncbi:poly polymerase catalytic domain-containing protein [Mycena pura]|uniref:Poly [ADP-ribose] polymerase n=1 Tax=Mycena pura TaxID=153505 RepID=A0AAD6YQ96_9AGAR|nr:poly polymerase catalytic domain-containing protein [Mycena pura]